MMKYMIYILVIIMLSVSASCVRERADDCKLPSRLVSVDSLMQRDPQAALDTLVGGTLSGTDPRRLLHPARVGGAVQDV